MHKHEKEFMNIKDFSPPSKVFLKNYIKISLKNLQHNFYLISSLLDSEQFFCPMVKSEAYGHGLVEISHAFVNLGARHLGVSLLNEAIKLRESGIKVPILVFEVFHPSEAKFFKEYGLTPVVMCWESLSALEEMAPLDIHLKFNTGMNRLGFELNDIEKIKKGTKLRIKGLCTHILQGEDIHVPQSETLKQMEKFLNILKLFSNTNIICHAFNSAALIGFSQHPEKLLRMGWTQKIGVRIGLALYGVQPDIGFPMDFKEVMSVHSTLVTLRKIKVGEVVSYGGTWKAHRDSLIGIIPLGYGDGLHRSFSNNGEVLVHGEVAPVIGHICMGLTAIDLTRIKGAVSLFDEVTLIGEQESKRITFNQAAQKIKTIPYELMTSYGGNLPRLYVDE